MRGVGLWQTDPAPWTGADAADPRLVLPNGSRYDFKPQLYNLDAVAYESVMLGSFRIFRCKEHYAGCDAMYYKNGSSRSHEWADMLLGFSRDGFSWSRTPVAQPGGGDGFELTPSRRYPFVGQVLDSPQA